MALEFVALQAHQMTVGDAPFEVAVVDCGSQTLFPGFDEDFASAFFEVAEVETFVEMAGGEFAIVDQFPDEAVDEDGLEDFGDVEGEAKAAGAGLVEDRERGVEGGAVDFREYQGVAEGVAEGDEGVDGVIGWALDSFLELGPRLGEDVGPGFIVGGADGALQAHDVFDVGGGGQLGAQMLDVGDKCQDVLTSGG